MCSSKPSLGVDRNLDYKQLDRNNTLRRSTEDSHLPWGNAKRGYLALADRCRYHLPKNVIEPSTDGLFVRVTQGQAGNAVQYITRNQALKRLQLRLSEFRCANSALASMPLMTRPNSPTSVRLSYNALQATVHPQGDPPTRAKEEDTGTEQDLLSCQGYQLSGSRAPPQQAQVCHTSKPNLQTTFHDQRLHSCPSEACHQMLPPDWYSVQGCNCL